MQLVGLTTELHGDQLEDHVIEVFQTASIEVNKQSFHAIHQLKNKKVVIVKLVNWQDALSILRGKKKLWNLDEGNKNRLRTKKNYVNESLCPLYQNLLAKCNALLKRKYIWNFYSVHGKLKIQSYRFKAWRWFPKNLWRKNNKINRQYKISKEESMEG